MDRFELMAQDSGYYTLEDFDTTIHGPWMKRWDIVHHNRHTESMKQNDGSSWHSHKA